MLRLADCLTVSLKLHHYQDGAYTVMLILSFFVKFIWINSQLQFLV